MSCSAIGSLPYSDNLGKPEIVRWPRIETRCLGSSFEFDRFGERRQGRCGAMRV
jgi:hypothetical protein